MESISIIVAVAVIATTAAVALLAAREPSGSRREASRDAQGNPAPTQAARRPLEESTPEPPVTTPAVSVPSVPAAFVPPPPPPLPRAAPTIGVPMVRPDPERLIQTEVVVPGGRAARVAALVRLAFWLVLSGGLVGLTLIGAGRAIASLFG